MAVYESGPPREIYRVHHTLEKILKLSEVKWSGGVWSRYDRDIGDRSGVKLNELSGL